MKRWIRQSMPFPVLSLLLWLSWLMLNGFSVGQAVLGGLLALGLPVLVARFWPDAPTVRRPGRLLCYVAVLMWDILIANLVVARCILGPPRRLQPRFVVVPLELRDDFAIVLLACSVSLTPGTVSADISDDRRTLLVHALDAGDPDALAARIRARYERPLKEIFQC